MYSDEEINKDFEQCLRTSIDRLNGKDSYYESQLNEEYERYRTYDDRYLELAKERLWNWDD